ncbi:MAG: nicotinate (nicotinamide) nucleotide adenylyltransferase [Solirubrobacterales bacterium]|nr:nicotinate (nicotinamide) nucleotide adenylyltransferase [Solirubrobacterales bacterium]
MTARYVTDDLGIAGQLGVFGSSFNPPHLAHVAVIDAARDQLGLDRVIVVPTGDAYHKDSAGEPGAAVRLRLAEAAFAALDGVEVSSIEINRDGPSYTCDTLEEIVDLSPDTEIHLIVGADAAKNFAGWHRPQRILELGKVAVAPRSGIAREDVESVFAGLGAGERVEFLEMPEVAISSSQIRQQIAGGEPVGHLLPAKVAQMIENEDRYGTD